MFFSIHQNLLACNNKNSKRIDGRKKKKREANFFENMQYGAVARLS